MKSSIGGNIKQPGGFSAFIPHAFPPKDLFNLPQAILIKAAEAERLVGKLDGITHTLPDIEFFLRMFVAKDAASSSQIEGTKATLVDAFEMERGIAENKTDADDVLHYIKALNYGLQRLKKFPLSLRFIREIHSELMRNARTAHFADPGQFRRSQNWIGGTTPVNALFVPPPGHELHQALSDFEKYLHDEKSTLPLIHMALMHAQFETIHPFLDGNGRAGRLLISMLLCQRKLLERPVLFLSSYFKKHQQLYYSRLTGYHNGEIEEWINFFMDGVIETANESIKISKNIRGLRDEDMSKIQSLAKRESTSGVLILSKLYGNPIVNTRTIVNWTKFTRAGALKAIERFVALNILESREEKKSYSKIYIYRKYVDIFLE